ncbi:MULTISPECIES: Hcp family type VI secretion system effector [unclassified Zymobacter]|uniref:Hcp family type VI secretion system effector n=1 Tax=unclassified Zymobacter TaxID=3048685 RepID=UPI0039C1CFD6
MIEITDFRYTVEQIVSATASSAGGATAGKSNFPDFSISKHIDKSSPKLFELCASGKHIKNIVIHINRAGGKQEKYLQIKLEEAIITNVSAFGSTHDDLPLEHVNFSYGRISFTYIQQSRATGQAGGNISGGWDRVANKTYAS